MKRIIFALPILVVAACAADGSFKSPLAMNQAERCDNMRLMLGIAQTNGASQETLDRMKENMALLCPVSVSEPAPGALPS